MMEFIPPFGGNDGDYDVDDEDEGGDDDDDGGDDHFSWLRRDQTAPTTSRTHSGWCCPSCSFHTSRLRRA